MNLSTKQKQAYRNREQTCICQGVGRCGRGGLRVYVKIYFIEVELICAVLIFNIQQSDSVKYTYSFLHSFRL